MSSQTPFWSPIMNEIRSNVPNATLMNEIRSDVPDVTNIFCNSDGMCLMISPLSKNKILENFAPAVRLAPLHPLPLCFVVNRNTNCIMT